MIIFKFPQLFKIILKFCIGNLNKEGVDTTLWPKKKLLF